MIEIRDEDVARLASAVREDLGDDTRWFHPDGYDSVALCLIDSIYSTGHRYSGVVNAVRKYSQKRESEGADATIDTASDLTAAVKRWGGPDALAEITNRWRCWSSLNAPYKAEVVDKAARLLAEAKIETVEDVRQKLMDHKAEARLSLQSKWLNLPGQGSGLTWNYFLMLAGVPGVKADRMVTRYVGHVIGRPVGECEAALLVGAVADQRDLNWTLLDHAIWRHESGRPIYMDEESVFSEEPVA